MWSCRGRGAHPPLPEDGHQIYTNENQLVSFKFGLAFLSCKKRTIVVLLNYYQTDPAPRLIVSLFWRKIPCSGKKILECTPKVRHGK
jgi:hypothetical protein